MISRKKFLITTSLGLLSTLIPGASLSYIFPPNKKELKELLKAAKKLRKNKRFASAKQAYEKIISLFPTEVLAYNGLRKNLLSKKGGELDVVSLYAKALNINPNDVRISHMLTTQYFDIAMGHKKLAPKLNINGRILLWVRDSLKKISETHPEKKNILSQLDKVNRYIDFQADILHPHKNKALKDYRKEQRAKFKNRFESISSDKARMLLSKLESKPYSKEREGHIREMYKVNIHLLRKEKKYTEALALAQTSLKQHPSDPYFIKEFRSLCKYLKNYEALISFETQNHNQKKTFWSGLALMDAHLKSAAANRGGSLPTVLSLLKDLEKQANDTNQSFELAIRKIKISIASHDLSEAKSLILLQLERMRGASTAHLIDRINYIAAEYYRASSDPDGVSSILLIASDPKIFIENKDEMKKGLALMNLNRVDAKKTHMESLRKRIQSL